MQPQALRVLLLAAAFSAFAAAPQDLPEAVQEEIRTAWEKHTGLSADLLIEANLPIGETRLDVTGEGAVHFLRTGEKERFRQRITAYTEKPARIEVKIDAVFDGSDLHMELAYSDRHEVKKTQPGVLLGVVPPGGPALLEVLRRDLDLQLKPGQGGEETYVLEGRPKEGASPLPMHKVVVHLDRQTAAIEKMEFYESEAKVTVTYRLSNLRDNPLLSESDFAVPKREEAPPAGEEP